jgi:hypothetical protein
MLVSDYKYHGSEIAFEVVKCPDVLIWVCEIRYG